MTHPHHYMGPSRVVEVAGSVEQCGSRFCKEHVNRMAESKEAQMKRMDFQNPKFNRGLNFTVRNGEKWANLVIGEQIALGKTNGPEMGVATVQAVIKTKFEDVPEYVTDNEHGYPTDLNELYDGMKAAYGDAFKWDSVVMCIGFRLVEYKRA